MICCRLWALSMTPPCCPPFDMEVPPYIRV
jgi:hypothetical protein